MEKSRDNKMAKYQEQNSHSYEMEIFSTSEGLQVIKSPLRVKILSILREKDLSFDEIVKLSGRAKSTVSGHLKELSQEGIIGSRPHPTDARKKIFFIKSGYVGKLHRRNMEEDLKEHINRYIKSENNPFEFYRLIFHTIRVSLMNQGVNIDPILHDAGLSVGEVLYDQLKSPTEEQFLQNIVRFWDTHNLGKLEVKNTKPLIINVKDCFECSGLPQLNRPACAFDTGILEAIFSRYYEKEAKVQEVECHAMGSGYCSFVIEI
ncbi:MAG TPA: ArsR family transcriptional regulator [Methanobacteriaceae archaeon]|nr:ArsR family transcriptional regulator [Methanobacteriaceae archaeon]